MAITLNEEIASKELINEFESNIRNIEGISPDDYRTLLESVAHQSAKKFREFNEVATEDKEKARIEAQKIVEWERKRKAKRIQDIKNAQTAKQEEEKRNRELITKIEQIENDLRNYKTEGDSTQTIIEILKSQVEKQRKLTRRIIFWTIITVIFILIIYFGFHSIKVLNLGQKIFKWILSAGGLFGFVNMTINALKSIKGK
jgi:cation transport ATPase